MKAWRVAYNKDALLVPGKIKVAIEPCELDGTQRELLRKINSGEYIGWDLNGDYYETYDASLPGALYSASAILRLISMVMTGTEIR